MWIQSQAHQEVSQYGKGKVSREEQIAETLSELNGQVRLQNIIDNNSPHAQRLTAFK